MVEKQIQQFREKKEKLLNRYYGKPPPRQLTRVHLKRMLQGLKYLRVGYHGVWVCEGIEAEIEADGKMHHCGWAEDPGHLGHAYTVYCKNPQDTFTIVLFWNIDPRETDPVTHYIMSDDGTDHWREPNELEAMAYLGLRDI